MITVGIVGGTGYTGVELLRLLSAHPGASIRCVSSRSEAGVRVDSMFPNLRGHVGLEFTEPDTAELAACDVVFFATPHNVAMREVPALLAAGTRVVDLSADFRLRDALVWQDWYGEEHACPELLSEAVYGLPERNRHALKGAQLVACAGCYPTAVQLGFMPLLEQGLVQFNGLIANAASGVSGAGRQGKVANILSEASDSMKAYGVAGHRHLPEIEQGLSDDAGVAVPLTFVPHLVPMIRGIHATLYATLTKKGLAADLQQIYELRFADEPFVDVLPSGQFPDTRSVRGANVCRLAVTVPQGGETVVVTAVEDNLVKGASGQAVQCMNIMFGFDEDAGLNLVALSP